MFGNFKGWIIAAVLAGLLVMLTLQAVAFNNITPVTAMVSQTQLFQPLTLDVDPASLVPMDAAGDDGSPYREAIKLVQASTARYETFLQSTSTHLDAVPAVQKLIDATSFTPSPILEADLAANVGYKLEPEDLVALKLAGDCCERLAALNMTENPDLAKKCFAAELALGAKMFNERLCFFEAFDGIGLLKGAAGGMKIMATTAKDDEQVKKLADFTDSVDKVNKTLDTMWKVIGAVDLNIVAAHAGDIYYFTQPVMKERMWRIESTLKLGRQKFSAARLADTLTVDPRLNTMAKVEKDPALLAAVQAAKNLTLGDYRSFLTQRQ